MKPAASCRGGAPLATGPSAPARSKAWTATWITGSAEGPWLGWRPPQKPQVGGSILRAPRFWMGSDERLASQQSRGARAE
eukprot:3557644-Alexandrium_andersonii.AAC.1